jgi:alcohol dehydrogenase class IV
VIVRFGLAELPTVLEAVGVRRPLLVAGPRWDGLELPHAARVRAVPTQEVVVPAEVDGILAVGGGSAIDTGKHASALAGLPLVSVPTTYSGAEWTVFYGIRSPDRLIRGGGAGAHPAGIVYDVELTLALPPLETAGTALNALAHCAEALYVRGRSDAGDEQALLGAPLIASALPRVLARRGDRSAREELLRGAMHGGQALAAAGLGLGHAMAQAVGGAYGLPHGAMNALCLPAALVFNRAVVPGEVARFGEAVGGDAVERTRALARAGGFERLRDFGVPAGDLTALGEAAAGRAGNQANPRVATPAEITALFGTIY